MKYTKTTVKRVAEMAAEYTGGAVRMAEPVYLGNGPCYVDGHNPELRWDTCVSKTAGREAVAYYAAAACRWGTLHRQAVPELLRQAHDELGSGRQPKPVRAASRLGIAAAVAAARPSGKDAHPFKSEEVDPPHAHTPSEQA